MDLMDLTKVESDLLKADGFFSFCNILKIICDVDDFRNWLKEEQGLEDDEHIFSGYLFFLNTCFRCFLDKILTENPFDLEEDYTLFRAKFVGVEIYNVPNTCEKIIFTKNVYKLAQNVIKSSEWDKAKLSIVEMNQLFNIISDIFKKDVASTTKLEKDEALNSTSIFNAYIYLNDLQRAIPLGYLTNPLLDTNLDRNHFKKNYLGYAYSLQYLWYKLLNTEDYERASLGTMYDSRNIYAKHKSNQNIIFENNAIDSPKDDWIALDTFFSIIKKEIIEPLEKKIENRLSFDPLLRIHKIDKEKLRRFLVKYKLADPPYFKKENKEALFQKLDYYFYWNQIDVLDNEQHVVFNGVPAFTSILLGHAKKREYYGSDKVCILRIKHPTKGKVGFDYSYGILTQAYSNTGISDYSGWLIFYSCATDYSGFGGSLHVEAETSIEKLLDDNSINVREIIVDKSLFRSYLESKEPPRNRNELNYTESDYNHNKFIVSEIRSQEGRFLGNVKGKLFEYIFYNWLVENQNIKPISLISDVVINNEQIDTYLETENEIHVFECKVAIHGNKLDHTITQINNKRDLFEELDKNITTWVVVFFEINDEYKERFRKEGINVCSNFKKKIEYWRKLDNPLNRDSRKIIKQVFDFQIQV